MDGKELTALMKKRDDLITFLNANLEKQIQESQQGLLKKFLAGFGDLLQTDETGKVLNNAFNRNLLLSVDKVFADYGKQHNVLILAALMQGVNQLMDFNADYYGKFEGETKLLPIRKKVVQNMRGWLGINADDTAQENGYLSTLIKSDAVKNQIKDFALKSVMGQAGWQDTKKNLEKLIAGDKDNLGALQKYHRNFSYDLLSQVDRATGKTYADDLKFEFAIYEGGLIETSREFCKKHNGNVYHISEIQKFNPQVAKQPNYNPVTDLGGYGCRHHLNWIPTSLALMLRPDAKKFVDENSEFNIQNMEEFIQQYDNLIGKEVGDSSGGENKTLQKIIAERKGWNKNPEVISKKEAEKYSDFLYRGFSKKEYSEEYGKTKYSGTGIYGSGDYFAKNERTAKDYALEKDAVIKIAIPPDFKKIKYSEIRKITDDYNSEIISRMFKISKTNPDLAQQILKNGANFNDVGFMATLLGYDGIEVDRGGDDYFVVLNKSKIKIIK